MPVTQARRSPAASGSCAIKGCPSPTTQGGGRVLLVLAGVGYYGAVPDVAHLCVEVHQPLAEPLGASLVALLPEGLVEKRRVENEILIASPYDVALDEAWRHPNGLQPCDVDSSRHLFHLIRRHSLLTYRHVQPSFSFALIDVAASCKYCGPQRESAFYSYGR